MTKRLDEDSIHPSETAYDTKDKEVMGNLNNQTWDELWNSPEAEKVRAKVRCCDRELDDWFCFSGYAQVHLEACYLGSGT